MRLKGPVHCTSVLYNKLYNWLARLERNSVPTATFHHWWSLWCYPDMTTETACWSVFRYTWYVASSRCRTQPHGWLFRRLSLFAHVTDALVSLHWLHVTHLVVYKIAALTFNVLHGIAPEYIWPVARVADLPGRQSLRSAGTDRLAVPPFKLSTIGTRASPWRFLASGIVCQQTLRRHRRCRPSAND